MEDCRKVIIFQPSQNTVASSRKTSAEHLGRIFCKIRENQLRAGAAD
jgi:hypothetical protein